MKLAFAKAMFYKFNFLNRYLRRRSFRRGLQLLQGFKYSREHGQKQLFSNIRLELSKAQIFSGATANCENFFGLSSSLSELCVRQLILSRFCSYELNTAILRSSASNCAEFAPPLPREWRTIFVNHEQLPKLSANKSKLLWTCACSSHVLLGLWKYLKITLYILTFTNKSEESGQDISYLLHMSQLNFLDLWAKSPSIINECPATLPSWLTRNTHLKSSKKFYHDTKLVDDFICSGIGFYYSPTYLPVVRSLTAVLKYISSFPLMLAHALYLWVFKGQWWFVLMLPEIAIANWFRLAPSEVVASSYLFHNSLFSFRPLWTYQAQLKGAEIALYFYSTNCEGIAKSFGNRDLHPGYFNMNWPIYYVWDNYQSEYLKSVIFPQVCSLVKPEFRISGPIAFSGRYFETPLLSAQTHAHLWVSIFDVPPVRISQYAIYGINNDYYVPFTSEKFLIDILESSRALPVKLFIKGKREIGKLSHPRYRNLLDHLHKHEKVHFVDPSVSPFSLIEKTACSISLPSTSTATIASRLGKPSIYYDPTSCIPETDRALHGIQLISSIDALTQWLRSCFLTQE